MGLIENVLLGVAILVLVSMAYAGIVAAPWVPARAKDKKSILRALGLRSGEKLYDLGCGDGWLSVEAGRTGVKVVGYEISLPLFMWAWIKSRLMSGTERPKIKFGDFWHADLSDADVIYVFLMPKAMERLRIKLETQCRPGTRVVSYVFGVPGWVAVETVKLQGGHKVFVYAVPEAAIRPAAAEVSKV